MNITIDIPQPNGWKQNHSVKSLKHRIVELERTTQW